jgi:predicted NUDIX family NTP pyrophosphohydrolase
VPVTSGGLLLYRRRAGTLEVLLVHPGGPFWARRDRGAWSIPKGELAAGEDPLVAAQREVAEELGWCPSGVFTPLAPIVQRGGKIVVAWAIEADWDPATLKSNTFRIELPKGSGRFREFPEVDRAAWFPMPEARARILESQVPLLEQLLQLTNDD